MASFSIPNTLALTNYVQLANADGLPVLLCAASVHQWRRQGLSSIDLGTVSLDPDDVARPWLTVTEAAQLHMQDVDDLSFEVAKAKLSRACKQGRVFSKNEGTQRRIEPNSLDAWRLAERERHLSIED